MSERIDIHVTEVGPRDGLQNEPRTLPTPEKIALVDALSVSGLREIETSSFVSPSWVPQLADAAEVFQGITRAADVVYSALVPNMKGFQRAMDAGAMKVAVFTAATESFCQRNINASFQESIDRFKPVVEAATSDGIPVRAYLSCIVRCPYEGPVAASVVRDAVSRLLELGKVQIALGETLGVANPDEIEAVLEATGAVLSPAETTLHLHDTNGMAIASVKRAVGLGVRSFDAACGGLGGCPFAQGAQGNLATERLLAQCEEAGWNTGVDRSAVEAAAVLARSVLGPMFASESDDSSNEMDRSS